MSIVPSPWTYENHYSPKARTVPTVNQATVYSMFPNIDRWAIGFDEMFETLKTMSGQKSSFPPYNVHKNGDDYTIEMALAGFRKEEVEVVVEDRTLTVRSDIEERNDIPEDGQFGETIHHGIAQRNFTTRFALGEYVEVVDASMSDGILTIKLETHLPDEKKPKVIEVN